MRRIYSWLTKERSYFDIFQQPWVRTLYEKRKRNFLTFFALLQNIISYTSKLRIEWAYEMAVYIKVINWLHEIVFMTHNQCELIIENELTCFEFSEKNDWIICGNFKNYIWHRNVMKMNVTRENISIDSYCERRAQLSEENNEDDSHQIRIQIIHCVGNCFSSECNEKHRMINIHMRDFLSTYFHRKNCWLCDHFRCVFFSFAD